MRNLNIDCPMLIGLSFALTVSLPASTHAQPLSERPYIDTTGEGVSRVDFDIFTMQVTARGTGQTRAAALASASANADKLRETLGRISAISGFRVTGTQPRIVGIGPGCEDYGTQRCVPTSYNAIISYTIVSGPPAGAAAALVVLEEQGFEAEPPNFSLSDSKAGAAIARRLAFENAKSAADVAAATAGCTRGKLLNITLDRRPLENEVIVVTGSSVGGGMSQNKLQPGFTLRLEAGKARLEAQVGTRFELVCR
jgi:uncharacterized protein YggE